MLHSLQEEMLAAITAKVLPIAAAACTEALELHWRAGRTKIENNTILRTHLVAGATPMVG